MRGSPLRSRNWLCFYLPKLVLVVGVWLVLLVGYIQLISSEDRHLVFQGPGDQDDHHVLLGLLIVLLSIYLIWVATAGMAALYNMLSLSAAPQFIFVLVITLLSVLLSLALIISWYFLVSSLQFVLLNGQINLFVWSTALCFSPIQLSNTINISGNRYFEGSGASKDELSSITGHSCSISISARVETQVLSGVLQVRWSWRTSQALSVQRLTSCLPIQHTTSSR